MNARAFPKAIVCILKQGGVGILPTDTLYGIVGSAWRPEAVRRIYRLRKRDLKKPMIVLIGKLSDVLSFGVRLDMATERILKRTWPGPVSVILAQNPRRTALIKKFHYLHRGTRTFAFRLPASRPLRSFLQKTGPLVAPSANLAGMPPAKTVRAAKKYFGGAVDFYVDAGHRAGPPSMLIAVHRGSIEVLRKGGKKTGDFR